jgi:hypothetical protein
MGVSEDFGRLTQLIFKDRWKPVGYEVNLMEGPSITIQLKSASGESKELFSLEPDVLHWCTARHFFPNQKGDASLVPIGDQNAYEADIDALADVDGMKLKAAVDALSTGRGKLTYDPWARVEKVLLHPASRMHITYLDDLVNGYFDILAYFQLYPKLAMDGPTKKLFQRTAIKHRVEAFARVTEKTVLSWNLGSYSLFRERACLDFQRQFARWRTLRQGAKALAELISRKGPLEAVLGVEFVLGRYKDYWEAIVPLLNALRVIIELGAGCTDPAQARRPEENIKTIRSQPGGDVLLEGLDSIIRHADAHFEYDIDVPNRVVRFYDSRSGFCNEVGTCSFDDLCAMETMLRSELLPVMGWGLLTIDTAAKAQIFDSFEFKMLLLRLRIDARARSARKKKTQP